MVSPVKLPSPYLNDPSRTDCFLAFFFDMSMRVISAQDRTIGASDNSGLVNQYKGHCCFLLFLSAETKRNKQEIKRYITLLFGGKNPKSVYPVKV